MICVYILKTQGKKNYYIGSTSDLTRRLNEHKNGQVASTKPFLPVELAFHQPCVLYSEAKRLENKLKRFKRKDFIEKIIQDGQIKMSL